MSGIVCLCGTEISDVVGVAKVVHEGVDVMACWDGAP